MDLSTDIRHFLFFFNLSKQYCCHVAYIILQNKFGMFSQVYTETCFETLNICQTWHDKLIYGSVSYI